MQLQTPRIEPQQKPPRPAGMRLRSDLRAGCNCDDNCTGCKPGPQENKCRNMLERREITGSCYLGSSN